jgi:hypothetical protein
MCTYIYAYMCVCALVMLGFDPKQFEWFGCSTFVCMCVEILRADNHLSIWADHIVGMRQDIRLCVLHSARICHIEARDIHVTMNQL